ncbi:MAG: glycosyltransferase [Nanoarchaeota archaeon]
MKKNSESTNRKFIHLIDHDGTIYGLVSPLSRFPEHQIITSFSGLNEDKLKLIEKLSKDKTIKCILHATGNKKYFYNLKGLLAKKFYNRFYIFLHVSPNHFLIKDRLNELRTIKDLSDKLEIKVLITSKELRQEYSYYGLDTIPIQVGIDFHINNRIKRLKKGKIISVCTAEEGIYHYIKGIDQFSKLMKDLKLDKQSLILGNKNQLFEGIKTKKVSRETFLRYLRNSKVYIQLSRTESYNLSAVYAKRLKIPVIVSNIEGHKDNVKFGFRVNNLNEAGKMLRFILKSKNSPKIKRVIERNYKDSLKRETLNNFRDSLNKLKN